MDALTELAGKLVGLLEAQARPVKHRIFMDALSVGLLGIAAVILLLAVLAALVALFLALQTPLGAPGALAVVALILAWMAVIVGGIGIWITQAPARKKQAGSPEESAAINHVADALSQGAKLVDEHPWAAAAAAFGIGLVLSKSESARKFVTSVIGDAMRSAARGRSEKP